MSVQPFAKEVQPRLMALLEHHQNGYHDSTETWPAATFDEVNGSAPFTGGVSSTRQICVASASYRS